MKLMLVLIVGFKTHPAELMLALSTSHMRASPVLLNQNPTFRARFFEYQVANLSESLQLKVYSALEPHQSHLTFTQMNLFSPLGLAT